MTLFGKISEVPRRWRAILAGTVSLLLALFFYPFKTTIVPRWRLHVVDETGAPARNLNVTEHWQHYTLESKGYDEILRPDESGTVDFPERIIRASIASRIVGAVKNFVSPGKFGPYASIVVWGSRDYATAVAVYQPETSPQTEIVVQRQK